VPRSWKGRRFPAEVLTPAEVSKGAHPGLLDPGAHRDAQPGPTGGPLLGRAAGRRSPGPLPQGHRQPAGHHPGPSRQGRQGTRCRRLFCSLSGGPLGQSLRPSAPPPPRRPGRDRQTGPRPRASPRPRRELSEEGYPLNFIQDQLGHASLAVTDRYLRHIVPAAGIGDLERRVWGLQWGKRSRSQPETWEPGRNSRLLKCADTRDVIGTEAEFSRSDRDRVGPG
jgi:hypothetical protein